MTATFASPSPEKDNKMQVKETIDVLEIKQELQIPISSPVISNTNSKIHS